MGVGQSIKRVDAADKVSGRAKFVADLEPKDALVAKVVRSTIANGVVKKFQLEKAQALEGVVKIVTCFDVPTHSFPTPGHPWSTDPRHQDISDRKLLNTRVRQYGDDIAVVIAVDEVVAKRAIKLIEVEYEEYTPILSTQQAIESDGPPIHEEFPDNILGKSSFVVGEGTYDEAIQGKDLVLLDKSYATQRVQHCHLEVPHSYAYMEHDRIVVVASTQIPHIVRRIIAQALDISFGKIRVVKPYIGGGFGNKQDALYEPLNAYLTTQVGGRCVKLELTREETLAHTRCRHPISYQLKAAATPDGTLVARKYKGVSDQGGYASHGHSIAANSSAVFKQLYRDQAVLESESYTVYTNLTTGGAMRGYGIPQVDFAMECMMDDLALQLSIDPIDFRLKNCMQPGYEDPHTHIKYRGNGLEQCIAIGREKIGWDEKRKSYANQTGRVRRGVGVAIFNYKTGVYPISLETASCRMILNQDGSMQIQLGATEIGQGADTVFTQMTAEITGITEDRIHIISTQDTDVTPFDTGAYASRQSYVTGKAVKKTGLLFKDKILTFAREIREIGDAPLEIVENRILNADGTELMTLEELGMEAMYSLSCSQHITAETTSHCTDNSFATGATFVEVEVDIPLGKVKVLNIINIHDSGTLLNPKLAISQVHGGMSMGLGYVLGEELLFDAKGKPLNDNLLDYKLPTALDTPELQTDFVEQYDESGPFGNKALGEPPTISQAPAIRNAVLHATGVAFDSLPLNPEKLVLTFLEKGLIKGGDTHV